MIRPPLAGRRILITRASEQYPETAALIEARGGMPVSLPCLAIEYLPLDATALFTHQETPSDILFTSANGVEAVARACGANLPQLLQHDRVAAVGEKTAEALEKYDIQPSIVPKKASQEGLFDAYQHQGLPTSLLFFRAEDGSDFLSQQLQAVGVHVQTIVAYRSGCPNDDCSDIKTLLSRKQIDAVILASARTAQHYLQRIEDVKIANNTTIIVISQQVADAADKLGLKVQLIAKQTSFASMFNDLEAYFS